MKKHRKVCIYVTVFSVASRTSRCIKDTNHRETPGSRYSPAPTQSFQLAAAPSSSSPKVVEQNHVAKFFENKVIGQGSQIVCGLHLVTQQGGAPAGYVSCANKNMSPNLLLLLWPAITKNWSRQVRLLRRSLSKIEDCPLCYQVNPPRFKNRP